MDAEPNKPTLNGQTVRLTYIKILSTKSYEFNKHLKGGLTVIKKVFAKRNHDRRIWWDLEGEEVTLNPSM